MDELKPHILDMQSRKQNEVSAFRLKRKILDINSSTQKILNYFKAVQLIYALHNVQTVNVKCKWYLHNCIEPYCNLRQNIAGAYRVKMLTNRYHYNFPHLIHHSTLRQIFSITSFLRCDD